MKREAGLSTTRINGIQGLIVPGVSTRISRIDYCQDYFDYYQDY